jgi:hypothetical protein
MSNLEISKIQTGLPLFPSDDLDPSLYGQFLNLYQAIQNLLRDISRYTGIDAPNSDIWSQLTPFDTLLSGNTTRLYVPASVAISRGQAVNLFSNAGLLNARLAQATSANTMLHGIANNTVAIGGIVELNILRGTLDSVGGLTVGTLYYLSTVAGALQSGRPAGAGQIIQSAGVGLGASIFLFDGSLSYIQL